MIVGIDDSRQVIRWVHQNKDKVNEVSEIFRCGDKFLVAVITSINKEGAMPLEDVNELVSSELKHEKKKQIILEHHSISEFICRFKFKNQQMHLLQHQTHQALVWSQNSSLPYQQWNLEC